MGAVNDENGRAAPGFGDRLLVALTEALLPVPLAARERASLRQRVLRRVHDPVPEGTITVRAGEGRWELLTELVRVKVLRDDHGRGERTSLMEFLPGAVLPPHVHECEETCLVLEGELLVGEHRLGSGDFHLAPAGTWHAETRSPTGCMCLVRAAIPQGSA
jgi:quercetin dioxygenase-like cupin family protein